MRRLMSITMLQRPKSRIRVQVRPTMAATIMSTRRGNRVGTAAITRHAT
jgi:hypothetical protein